MMDLESLIVLRMKTAVVLFHPKVRIRIRYGTPQQFLIDGELIAIPQSLLRDYRDDSYAGYRVCIRVIDLSMSSPS